LVICPDLRDGVLARPDLGGQGWGGPMRAAAGSPPVNVNSTTFCTVSGGGQDFRPRPSAIPASPSAPSSVNRFRQRRTASESIRQRRAISSFATHPTP